MEKSLRLTFLGHPVDDSRWSWACQYQRGMDESK